MKCIFLNFIVVYTYMKKENAVKRDGRILNKSNMEGNTIDNKNKFIHSIF
jgi:hypothetical protein